MAHMVTITVNDTVYEALKPFIEQKTIDTFFSKVLEKDLPLVQTPNIDIAGFRGSLHQVVTSDIREEIDRDMSLSQNSVSFVPSSWKKRLKAVFSIKSKVAVPKTEVLGQPHI